MVTAADIARSLEEMSDLILGNHDVVDNASGGIVAGATAHEYRLVT
jgi:hypothetical protein